MIDTYVIPFKKQFIIYSPLKKISFIVNKDIADYIKSLIKKKPVEHNDEIDTFLSAIDFFSPSPAVDNMLNPLDNYKPSQAVLMMTGKCNLRCIYCYAKGGDHPDLNMSFSIAKQVIDEVWKNAGEKKEPHFSLTFHGGGEPTQNWDVMKESVEYGRSKDIFCKISMSTNGVMEDYKKSFIIKHFNSLNISFDGTVQEKQRPSADGGDSFYNVLSFIKELDRHTFSYSIRMTVIPETFESLPESIDLICQETNCRTIQVEPYYNNSRGIYTDPGKEDIKNFTKYFIKSFDLAKKHGRHLFYSGSRPWIITNCFCLCHQNSIVVTPEGDIVSCFEIYDRSHYMSSKFITGKITLSGVEINTDKLKDFIAYQEKNRENCKNCFCYYHCGGDCPSRNMAVNTKKRGRCDVNRIITKELIIRHILENNTEKSINC